MFRSRVANILVLTALSGSACDASRNSVPPAHSTATPLVVGSTSSEPLASAEPPPPVPGETAIAAVRRGKWGEAKKLLAELPADERARPNLRYLRARVASELGEHAQVLEHLDGLVFPLFEDEVAKMRAEAQIEVGPFAEAAQYFVLRATPRDLLKAARAYVRAKDDKKALEVIEKAKTLAERMRRKGDERAAHGMRAEILVRQNKLAEAKPELVWLFVEAPASSEGKAAQDTIRKNSIKLSNKELQRGIEALVEAGAPKDALEWLDKNPGAMSRAEAENVRAMALFKARDYKKSAAAFIAASKVKSGRTAEQIYYAGRSLARIKKEDEAIAKYREVQKRFAKESWAERAGFQRAQLELNLGNHANAAAAFTDYLAKYPKGQSRDDAEYALALSYLSAQKPDKARKVFSELADKAKKNDVGTFRQLEGVGALRAGDKDAAISIFTRVARERPLTWAAVTARARLSALSAPIPSAIEPAAAAQAQTLEVSLPTKVQALLDIGLDRDAEGMLEANEQAASAAYPGRESEALCAMYGKLEHARRRYKVGSAAVAYDALMRAPSAAERWGWECLYPTPYAPTVSELEKRYELPQGFVFSIMRQESAFDPEAVSPVGAQGLMQLMPTTAEQAAREAKLPFEPTVVRVPDTNLELGGFYLGKLMKTFQGSMPLAAAGYNAGPGAVSRWIETAKEFDVDVWVARIPYEETRNYVGRVMGNYTRYAYLRGGEAAVPMLPLEIPSQARAADEDY